MKGGERVKQKSEAQIFLELPEKLDAIVENKLIEKKQYRDLALGITANMGGERVQSSGSKSRLEDAIVRLVDTEAEIDAAVDKLIAVRQSVVELIERLDSPMEYRLLHDRYIKYMSLTEIAEKYDKEYSWVTTTHGRALRNVGKLLHKGVTE